MSRRRYDGKLFHMWGPAALKLRSPKLLCIRGMRHVLTVAERSGQRSHRTLCQQLAATHTAD